MDTKILAGAKILAAILVSAVVHVQAAPIVFTAATYDTAAFAVSGALADASSDTSPPSALPILSTATVSPANDFATSFALASSGLLSAFSEADSFAGAAGANSGAQSHFVATFLGAGRLNLHLVFDSLTSAAGGAMADATLFVLLTNTLGSTTTTLFDNFFSSGQDVNLQFTALGNISTFDLLLFSQAATTGIGQSAQNFSQVTFDGTIPLPPTPALVVVGLAAMFVARRQAAGGGRAQRRS